MTINHQTIGNGTVPCKNDTVQSTISTVQSTIRYCTINNMTLYNQQYDTLKATIWHCTINNMTLNQSIIATWSFTTTLWSLMNHCKHNFITMNQLSSTYCTSLPNWYNLTNCQVPLRIIYSKTNDIFFHWLHTCATTRGQTAQ